MNLVTIHIEEYKTLIKKAERIETLERLLRDTEYVTMKEVKTILDIDINEKEVDEDGKL